VSDITTKSTRSTPSELPAIQRLAEQLRARKAANPSPLQRWLAQQRSPSFDEAQQPTPRPTPTRQRKPSVASVIRQMKRAGVEIAGCEVNPRDGTVRVLTGKPNVTKPDDERNEWDAVQ
jgi:hypothetical protein